MAVASTQDPTNPTQPQNQAGGSSLYSSVFGTTPTSSTPATMAGTGSSTSSTPAPSAPAPSSDQSTGTTPSQPNAAPTPATSSATSGDLNTASLPPLPAPPAPQNVPSTGSFTPTAQTYTPGNIPMNVPTFGYDQILGDATVNNGTTQGTDALVQNITANPESMSPQVVGQLEAANKDELAQQQQQEDQQAKEMGAASGIADSPWLAAQRLANQRSTNQAIVAGNRNIETQAAQTNFQNKLAAAQTGQAQTQLETNAKQTAVQLASNTALQSAAAQGDRMALREQVQQAATQLGQSADQLMLNYTLGQMGIAAERNGQQLNYEAAMAQLKQGGQEFQESVAMQLAQMNQQNQQFGADYGLSVAQTELGANNANQSLYANTFGG